MWPWFLILLSLSSPFILGRTDAFASPTKQPPSAPVQSSGPNTSAGPTSDEEAALLWSEGQKEFETKQYDDVIHHLSRLIDRYPSYPGQLEAHLLLGKTYIALGRLNLAISPLRFYVEAQGYSPNGLMGRILLARSYLGASRPQEAYLSADEVLGKTKPTPTNVEAIHLEALLIKSASLIAQNQDVHAERVLSSFEAILPKISSKSPSLESEAHWLKLSLKTRSCAKFPSAPQLTEAETVSQYQRRGECLLEATLLVRDLLSTNSYPGRSIWSNKAIQTLDAAFQNYLQACANPPIPKNLQSQTRTKKKDRVRFRTELSDHLKREGKNHTQKALDLVKSWANPEHSPENAQMKTKELKELKELKEELDTLKKYLTEVIKG